MSLGLVPVQSAANFYRFRLEGYIIESSVLLFG